MKVDTLGGKIIDSNYYILPSAKYPTHLIETNKAKDSRTQSEAHPN